jgi:hypothetical protein
VGGVHWVGKVLSDQCWHATMPSRACARSGPRWKKAEGVDVKKIASLGGIHKIVKLCFKVEKF